VSHTGRSTMNTSGELSPRCDPPKNEVPNEVSDSAEVSPTEPYPIARIWFYGAKTNLLGAALNPRVPGVDSCGHCRTSA
jgi:hypothetical protein